jgi:tRNA(Ile)-lysidine synthase
VLFAIEKLLKEEVGVAPGERIAVGVSGGPDSVALLHLLQALSRDLCFDLHVAHLDHALRQDSAQDALFVADLCRQWGVPLTSKRIDVRSEARRIGVGLEEGARLVRRAFLEEVASAHGCRWIALGHHRGDQAETLLHRLLRGTAVSGLAAMALQRGSYLRPLLEFSRDEIVGYLRKHGLSWREDESNGDFRFTRNRLRHQVLPLLTEFNPRLEEHLSRLSRRVALEEDYWRGEEERALAAVRISRGKEGALDRPGLLRLHPALRFRVIRRAILDVRGDLEGVSATHIAAIERILLSGRPQAETHLPGIRIRRRYDRLCLSLPASGTAPYSLEVNRPGRFTLPDGRVFLAELTMEALGENLAVAEFDAAAVPFPLAVRSFRAGDRFHPSGARGGKKLKDFFIDQKIDLELRRTLPLVVSGEILWIAGVRRCNGRRPVAGRAVLRLTIESGVHHQPVNC